MWLLLLAHVAVPGPVTAQEPTLTRVFQIGASDSVPEYAFGAVADVTFGPGGEVYVLDALNSVARSYDRNGRYIRSIGGKGEGPGEMRYPNRLVGSSAGITIFDASLSRAVAFDSSGQHVETTRLDSVDSSFGIVVPLRAGQRLAATSGTHIGASLLRLIGQSERMIRREGPAARSRSDMHVALIDANGEPETIFTYDHGFIMHVSSNGVGTFPRYWGQGGGWAVSGDSLVALVNGYTGAVRILEVGAAGWNEVRTGRVPITPQPIGEKEWREVEAVVREERTLSRDLHLLGPAFKPQIGEPVFSDDGTLWVRRIAFDATGKTPPSDPVYLRIPVDDQPQSVVRLPRGFMLKAVRGDLLLGQRRLESGVDVVELWRMES